MQHLKPTLCPSCGGLGTQTCTCVRGEWRDRCERCRGDGFINCPRCFGDKVIYISCSCDDHRSHDGARERLIAHPEEPVHTGVGDELQSRAGAAEETDRHRNEPSPREQPSRGQRMLWSIVFFCGASLVALGISLWFEKSHSPISPQALILPILVEVVLLWGGLRLLYLVIAK